MSLANILDRIAGHKLVDFVAPIPDADATVVFSLLPDGTPYRFQVSGVEPGWHVLHPGARGRATVVGPAPVWDIVVDSLRDLPRFLVVAALPLSESAWLCVPFSAADAEQRGWMNGEPKALHLVREHLEPLDLIEARDLGGVLLFDQIATHVDTSRLRGIQTVLRESPVEAWDVSAPPVARNVISLIQQRRASDQAHQARVQRQQAVRSDEARLRSELDFAGAQLINWSELSDGFRVTWEHEGHTYTMPIQRDLRVESAGICLNETDRHYTLAAIVHVMAEARRQHRPGA